MSIRKEEKAQIAANAMFGRGNTKDQIVAALETEFGEDITLMRRKDVEEIWFVYDDSRPSYLVFTFPTEKKG